MKKIVLTENVIQAINFLLKACESYYGASNSHIYQPHVDALKNNITDEIEKKDEEKTA
jgi:thymidylate synthase